MADDSAHPVRVDGRLEPNPATADVYARLFEAYIALYPATAPILRPLSEGAA